ncbi:hypothetical protein ACFE04_007737 [Oxalis oulophora]
MASTTTLNLLVDTKNQKVLFAEASHVDFINFLFSIIAIPSGALIDLIATKNSGIIGTHCTMACLRNLQSSLHNLSINYRHPKYQAKIKSIKPMTTFLDTSTFYLLQHIASPSASASASTSTSKYLFKCSGCNGSFLNDLTVKPMCAVSSVITSLKTNSDLKNLAFLEEKQVELGKVEAMKLVQVMLQSNTVLTDMFINDSNK